MQGLYTTSTSTPEAQNAYRDWAALVAALAGTGMIQQYADGVRDTVAATNGRKLLQFPAVSS